MAFLNYEYKMKITYSEPVGRCHFTIKSIPADDFRQKSISYSISIAPPVQYSKSQDSFGNIQIIGKEDESHSEFEFVIKGLVETRSGSIVGGINPNTIGMYKYPHGMCIPGESISSFFTEIEAEIHAISSEKEKCIKIMNLLYGKMTYEHGSTTVKTTAEEAFTIGKGVCQDYSHIYITLLRLFKIPARYVCGLIVGEGESHSWVEAVCKGSFIAFDPTHNVEVSDEYIKLGMGRDAFDCAINRGVMW
ncbi:MAG: transglutaminase family protein, partial [Clostridiales bacterium]|nr:transglutaminase family protein [Clostridiales bacterium]